jgi:hypothetical protein
MLNEDAQSSSLHRDLVVQASDIILTKPRFGGIFGTDLNEVLRAHDAEGSLLPASRPMCAATPRREKLMPET